MASKLPTVEQELDARDQTSSAIALAGGILNVIAKAAADPKTDVDKLERLLAMQERVLQREAEQAFNAAMRSAQDAIQPILKNRKNSSTNSSYADLEAVSDAIDPVFRRHGFSSSFGTADCPLADHYRVTCRLSHTAGHHRDYQADVPADTAGIKGNQNKTATHGFGSALSYGRRYLKLLIADVPTTDDDGRAASKGGGCVNAEQRAILNGLADAVESDKMALCRYLASAFKTQVDSLSDVPFDRYNEAVSVIRQKNAKAADTFLTGGK